MANESVTVTQSLDQVTVVSDGPIGLNAGGTILGALNVGVDGTGHDVKFFGDTAGKYMQWDQSANKLFVNGEIEVNGTATTFNSTVITIDDPIFTLGGQQRTDALDDSKDRGIEFFYHDGAQKTGFMGYDDSADAFTFLTSATNSNEVFSGTEATIHAGTVKTPTIGTQSGNLAINPAGGGVTIDGDLSIDGTHRIKLGTGISGLQRRSDANLELVVSDNTGQINLVTIGTAGGKAVNFRTHTSSAASATTVASVDESGNFTLSGTVDGRDVATDGTKLDGIEASADVTDATNVAAAGALMLNTGGNIVGDVDIDGDLSIDGTHRIKLGTGISGLQRRSDANLELVVSDNTGQINLVTIGSAGGKAVNFKTHASSAASATTVASVDESGNLSVAGNISGDASQNDQGIEFSASALTLRNGAGGGGETITLGSNGAVVNATSSSSFDFTVKSATSASALHVESSDGKVGIGTASPAHLLHVYSSGNGEIEVERASGATILTQAQASLGRFGTSSNHNLQLMVNNSGYVTVTTAGNVGIGTSAPTRELHLDSGDALTTFKISNSTSGATITDGFDIELSSTTARLNNREGNIELAVSNSNVATLSSDGLSLGDNLFFRCGDSADLTLSHDASNSYIANETGDLYIRNSANDKDIIFQSDDGSGGVETYFFLDGSASGGYPYTVFPDNSYLAFGSGNDLQIRHSGTKTEVYNYVGDLEFINYADDKDIIFQSDDGSGGVTEYFRVDGGTEEVIFSKNTEHLDNVLGGFGSESDLTLSHDGSNSHIANATGDLKITQNANDKDIVFSSDNGSGGNTPYLTLDGSVGYSVASKHVRFEDNIEARFGAGSDFRIYHDGNNNFVDGYNGHVYIRNTVDNHDIVLQTDDGSGGITEYFRVDGGTEQVVFSKALNYSTTLVNDSNYTTTRSDSVILFHSMSTYRYLTLASADCVAGRKIHVKNRDNSEYIYIQTEGSENIDGSSSIIGTQTARGSITLIADGSNWFILNKYST